MNRVYRYLLILLVIVMPGSGIFAQEKLKANGGIPVLAWVGVPEGETTLERFKELRASGININYSNYSGVEAVEKALDAAGQAGVKLIPFCPGLKSKPERIFMKRM